MGENDTSLKKATTPKVSIGIPVRNGENFLEEAIKSVLDQTFSDLELIISDNGSTDRTPDICRKYAKRDKRIRFVRYEENIGAVENFNRGFQLSRGEYFKWLAHDDYIHPKFLEKCVKILDKNNSVHLVYSKAMAVNEQGDPIKDYSSDLKLDSDLPRKRLFESICVSHPLMEIFGLIRSSALRKTRLLGKYSSADRVLLAEMALLGKAQRIPEYLIFNRLHPKQHYKVYTTRQARGEWWNPKLKNKITFPHWRLMWEFFKSVKRSSVKGADRRQCYFILIIWIKKHMGYLIRNLFFLDRYWKK
jgi:glycosyltransferase involved in cell wall biosynthesis